MTAPAHPLASFHPLVRAWFTEELGAPSAPQRAGRPAIASGADTLILAPTGTGKTLSAFLWELDALIREGQKEPLANAVHLLYVSPLKALSNDIQRNLERPLAQMKERFAAAGEVFPEIRVAVPRATRLSRRAGEPMKQQEHCDGDTHHSLSARDDASLASAAIVRRRGDA